MKSSTIGQQHAAVEKLVTEACLRSERSREAVTLVGASKRQPVESLEVAFECGLRSFGENRVQEAQEKQPRLSRDISWQLLGPLQSNKVVLAVRLFDCFHAIDRIKIARALNRECLRQEVRRTGFLEVNLGDEATKHGFAPREVVDTLIDLRSEFSALELVGLMAIPPRESEVEKSRHWFRQLRNLRDEACLRDPSFGGLLSMGMSSDFGLAIEEGATHVRVGTGIFGPRPQPR